MIPIQKSLPPNSLSQYRRDINASYENMPSAVKEELRQSLLNEQGAICCYCMKRIKPEQSRIEHWHSQTEFPDEQLNYDNMMLACQGNEGQTPSKEHCDVKKGDAPLKFNPSNPNHAPLLKPRYLNNGCIESDDNEFNEQLNSVLNLNETMLKGNRKKVYESVKQALTKKGWTLQTINGLTQKYQSRNNNEAKPFCGVVLYWLEKFRLRCVSQRVAERRG